MADRDGQKCTAVAWSPRKRRSNPTTNTCWLSLKLWLERRLPKRVDQATLHLRPLMLPGIKGGRASGTKGGGKGGGNGAPCKYFLSPKGCKFGSKCKYPHSMNELSKAERFKKCLNCGSEEHRAQDCKAGKAEPKTQDQKPSVQAVSSSGQSVAQATPVLNMETFMQQAVQGLRQLEANPPRNDATLQSQPPQPQPEGVSTASQPSSTPNPGSPFAQSCPRVVSRFRVPLQSMSPRWSHHPLHPNRIPLDTPFSTPVPLTPCGKHHPRRSGLRQMIEVQVSLAVQASLVRR